MRKYKIGVLAGYAQTIIEMTDRIRNTFGDYVEFESLHLAQLDNERMHQLDVVVSSSKYLIDYVKKTHHVAVPMIAAERNIEISVVPQLLSIERGTRVYVLGVSKEAAEEIISALRQIGIYHLELLPFYYQIDLHETDTLIAPVRVKQLEKTVKKYISIEYNNLNIFSIMELAITLGLSNKNLSKILDKFRNDTLNVNQRTDYIIQNLQALVENSTEGLLAINHSGDVLTCNQRAKELLQLPGLCMIGMNLKEMKVSPSLVTLLRKEQEAFDQIIDIGERKLIINKKFLPNPSSGYLVYFQDVNKVQKDEHFIRRSSAHRDLSAKYTFFDIAGNSPIIKRRIEEAKRISRNNYSVLIQGDNGTGKELFAQAIHNYSNRKNEPFVPVNIASISDSLLESELFGYEEGAFTGATKGGKSGLFELAHGGTLFFDEIGDASDAIQQKLLRVLQEKEIFRVGGTRLIKIDVRIIAATNRNLFALVAEGKFRKDLYYRLKVLQLNLPTLQERSSDIPNFVEYFFTTIQSDKRLSSEALKVLQEYRWPGNVRELYNLLCYFDSIYDDKIITVNHLPPEFFENGTHQTERMRNSEAESLNSAEVLPSDLGKILELFTLTNEKLSAAKIQKMLGEEQLVFSRAQIRYRLEKLRDLGYVDIGATRQGTTLAPKGLEYVFHKTSRS